MERRHIDVRFAYKYGDKSLPKIKELVCEKPDSQKKIILEYLREHCVICCPGTERDIINPRNYRLRKHLFGRAVLPD